MKITLSPSNPLVRAIYCVSLIVVAFSLFRRFGVFNFKAGAELMIIMAIAPTAMLFLLVVFRLVGVVIGKFKLDVAATTGPIYILRMAAILFMAVSSSMALFAFVGALMSSRSGAAGYAIVSGILGGGSPIGLLLFESSRILERELLIESDKT